MIEKDLVGTPIEIKFSFEGSDYIAKAKVEKVEDVKYNYVKSAKLIKTAIKKVDEPKTITKITQEVRKSTTMSQKFITKILDMFEGDMWEHTMYDYPHGGRSARNYKLLKKKKDK